MKSTWCGVLAFSLAMAASPSLMAQEGGMGGAAAGGMGGAAAEGGASSEGGGGFGGGLGGGGFGEGGFGEGGDGGFGGSGGSSTFHIDADGDGFTEERDCDDTRADIHPGASEYAPDCNSGQEAVDMNCDGYVPECTDYGYDDGGSVPLANLIGTLLFGLWMGRAAWRRR